MHATSPGEDSIRRLLEEQVAAWNAGDAEGWCKHFAPDAGFVNILGMRFEGRDANAHRHAELFAGIFKGSRLEIRDLEIRVLDAASAIADAVLDLAHFQKLPPGIRPTIGNDVLRTRMHYVMVRDGDGWCVVYSQNTAVMSMPPVG
jgi:uncharacterized protein (TIGR02246 family)